MFLKSLVITLMMLFLFSFAVAHDGPPDPRRVVHAQHSAYLLGLIKGVEIGGGYPSITIKEMVDGFISAWNDAYKAFSSAAMSHKATLGEGEELSSEWILRTYRDFLGKKGIDCSPSMWSDTNTLQYCR